MSDAGTARDVRRRRAIMGVLNRTTLHPWTTDRDALADEIVAAMSRVDRETEALPADPAAGELAR